MSQQKNNRKTSKNLLGFVDTRILERGLTLEARDDSQVQVELIILTSLAKNKRQKEIKKKRKNGYKTVSHVHF